jgi:Fe-S-cluster containining protein
MPSTTLKKSRPKDPLKAYKQRVKEMTSRVVDPFIEMVLDAISFSRRVHPRDGSEAERRLAIAFNLFPKTIVRAAGELRSLLRRRPDRSGMLRLGRAIGRLVDDEIGRAKAESTAPPSACRKGCHFCCHLPVETTVPQILVIADHLKRTLPSSEIQDLRKRMDEYEARVAQHPSGKGLALCPLNLDGACSVYEVRPTICRSFNSTDAGACERALANEWETPLPMDYGPIGAEVAVQTGYQIAGVAHDHRYRAVPLVPALRLALDLPELFQVEDFDDTDTAIIAPGTGGGAR